MSDTYCITFGTMIPYINDDNGIDFKMYHSIRTAYYDKESQSENKETTPGEAPVEETEGEGQGT